MSTHIFGPSSRILTSSVSGKIDPIYCDLSYKLFNKVILIISALLVFIVCSRPRSEEITSETSLHQIRGRLCVGAEVLHILISTRSAEVPPLDRSTAINHCCERRRPPHPPHPSNSSSCILCKKLPAVAHASNELLTSSPQVEANVILLSNPDRVLLQVVERSTQ